MTVETRQPTRKYTKAGKSKLRRSAKLCRLNFRSIVAPNVRLLCNGCGWICALGIFTDQQLAEVDAIGDPNPREHWRIICKRCFGEDWTAVAKPQP